jgi:hypothetical protein
MAVKRPTGELPKRNSDLAKFIAGVKSNNLTPAQARTAAGLYRDMEKAAGKKGFTGFGSLDKSGAALGKAIKQTQAKTAPKPTMPAGTTRSVSKGGPIKPFIKKLKK